MIVNHFNTFPYGGAANAALRLHSELRNQGVESRFHYSMQDRPCSTDLPVHPIEWTKKKSTGSYFQQWREKRRVRNIHRLYDRHLAGRDPNLEVFSMADQVQRSVPSNASDIAGIVHLHWIAFLGDYATFFRSIPDHVPIVWTLHDMNPLTGGCHYSNGCTGFKHGCGECPQVVAPGPKDISNHGFRIKQNALKNKNISIVAPSRWMRQLAEGSPVFPASTSFHHISLGFDLKKLHPMDKLAARKELGIATTAPLIGFGAESIDNRRKGLDLLFPALARLKSSNIGAEGLILGGGELETHELDLPKMHSLGFLNDPEKISQFYSACDLVVVPSREDNQPQVGLEAMACGTPVVGFDIGGISEYVKPGITGWLAKPENPDDLARQIRTLIEDIDVRTNMGKRCRKMMESEFDIKSQAGKYAELYQRIESGHSKRRIA